MGRNKSPLSKLGLWPQVALAISAGFILLFFAFTFLEERALQGYMERQREERIIVAQFAANQVDDAIEQAVFTLEQASEHIKSNPNDSILAALTEALEAETVLTHFSSGLTLLDANGQSLSSLPAELYPAGADLSGLRYITESIEQERITISDPFQDSFNGRPVVAITVPLFENNRLQGLLSGLFSLTNEGIMAPLNQLSSLDDSEHAVLVDNQGRIIVSTFNIPFLSPGEHHAFYRQAMAAGAPAIESVPFELELPGETVGHLHVMAFAPLNTVPWGLAAGGDEADIFAGVRQLRIGLIVMGVVALTGIWLLTLFGTRRLVQPVQQLTRAADQIAAGDLTTPLQVQESGEIGTLAAALDRMRNQLLKDIRDLEEWNDKLEARVEEQTRDLRQQHILTEQLLREVVEAQERERRRLARELHDEIGQSLTAIELSLGRLFHSVSPDNEPALQRVNQSRSLIEQATTDLRAIIAALRPGTLDELGLVPALEWIGDQMLRPIGISVTVESSGLDGRLPGEIETTLFRIAQEAMNNVGRHSQATSLDIRLQADAKKVLMTLSDDGTGLINLSSHNSHNHDQRLGIVGMKERASLVGGTLSISSLPGKGTAVSVSIPITSTSEGGEPVSDKPIRMIIVDDHAIMREGLVKLLENEPDIFVAGLASTGRDAIEMAKQESVDLVLLDIVMEDMNGIEAARQILAARPTIKIIMLTMYAEKAFLEEAFRAGVSGYFLKGSNSDELITTIRKVQSGGIYLSPKMTVDLDGMFETSQDQT